MHLFNAIKTGSTAVSLSMLSIWSNDTGVVWQGESPSLTALHTGVLSRGGVECTHISDYIHTHNYMWIQDGIVIYNRA